MTKFDGVRLALLSNRFEGICRKMANTLLRSARSGVINIAHDFSCCILTANAELLSVAESLPIHVFAGPDQMARTMKEFSDDCEIVPAEVGVEATVLGVAIMAGGI
mgnify:CR=1 FL=1